MWATTTGTLPTVIRSKARSAGTPPYFKHPSTPPLYLYLYYINDPCKLFSCDEYHYQNHKGLLLLPVIFLPWILALVVFALLGVEPPQAI